MKLRTFLMLALLCAVAQGVCAQTSVKSEQELKDAITNGANIQLNADIQLSAYLDIDGKTVTIDLNGHKLFRNLSEHGSQGHVIWVHNESTLTLTSTATGKGKIEGGKANNGGAIHIPFGNTVIAENVIFQNNSAADHAGAIWNNGTFTATNCTFENNTASDVGGIYNSVTADGAGTTTLTDCTFTGNAGTAGAGALANALGATVMTIENCTITGNTASGHGGGIWNGGTLTVTNSAFTNNTANDVGGIYNAVSTDGTTAGTATLKGCTFTGNEGTAGAGALANALGATMMTIEDCTIENNTAYEFGAGIWNGGTLNIQGTVTVTNNKNSSGFVSNVYLKNEKVITVTGDLVDSSIGVELESTSGTFTRGYKNYHNEEIPSTFFTADRSIIVNMERDSKGEACLTSTGAVYYIERSWDDTNMKVVSTEKSLTGSMIGYDVEPTEGQYKEVTSHAEDWFGMGGYSTTVPEYYVVSGNVNRKAIVVQGKDVHLILCDNSRLTLTGGLKLEGNNKLYIHCQSYSGNMGQLIVSNSYENAAGIGSAWDRVDGEDVVKTVGQLVIYGGHIEATGGDYAAGIGSCNSIYKQNYNLCRSVTVYGGYVEAIGGKNAAGIGGGTGRIPGGTFNLYDGTVIAKGGEYAPGVGGGGGYSSWFNGDVIGGRGGNVNIYGGELTATGGERGAGIGGGAEAVDVQGAQYSFVGGVVNIYNGKVTATGGKGAAGIGGGYGKYRRGAEVYIYNGIVTATGGEHGAGFGGGEEGEGGTLKVLDGTVIATGGIGAAGVGGGYKGNCTLYTEQDVYIAGGIVIAKAGEQGGDQNRAFGPGKDCYKPNIYFPKLGTYMMVGAGNNGSVEKYVPANERQKACLYNSYAEVSPCTHAGCTYTVTSEKHTRHCNYCADTKEENHFFEAGKCVVCNYETDKTFKVTYCLPDLEDEVPNQIYKEIVYHMVPGPISLPVCEVIPDGYEFEGWAVSPRDLTTYLTRPYEIGTLLEPLFEYTITENEFFAARFKEINVALYNDQFNGETLFTYDERTASTVTLQGRTLYKDGNWNTLCLPFSLTEEQLADSPLADADIRTLASSSFDESDGTLTLTFTPAEGEDAVTAIEAGTPYIVKWAEGNQIDNPTFRDVKIDYTYLPAETDVVTFRGNYSPVGVPEEGDNTMLYLSVDNAGNSALFYPNAAMTINSFRSYFQLNGLTAGEPTSTNAQPIKAFVLNFGEETGIEEITTPSNSSLPSDATNGSNPSNPYFTLDGRRLGSKPTDAGLYIHNGTKVLIK